jgi:flagellar hook-basal body complex protein FliE
MAAPLAAISSAPAALPELASLSKSGPGGGEFGAVLENAVHAVENIQQKSAQAVEKFLSGEGEELHTTILATQRAELALELFLQVRNKVVQAYQEVMRMPM